ncbi:class I adenylate-forming enzyme family protein [Cnuibacter sp. UC19_7]|uniref:class I adenylate-forming enzyme family protein n=1 Tax=Cnuibacter sp. UC19_7 TaxID=3350166 RepID=UPI00366CDD46
MLRSGQPWRLDDVEAQADTDEIVLRAASVSAGSLVATALHTGARHLALHRAVRRIGAALAPLSPALPPALLSAAVDRLGPALLLVESDARASATTTGVPTATLGGSLPVAAAGRRMPAGAEFVFLTSGTTADPKAVVLDRRAVDATDAALLSRFPLDASDTVLSAMPQHHTGGWTVFPLAALEVGARVVVLERFEATAVRDALVEHGVTTMMGVPTHWSRLLDVLAPGEAPFPELRHAVVGGAPVPPGLVARAAAHDIRLIEGYGLTEAGPNVAAARIPGGQLHPYDGVTVRLADDGEVLVSSPSLAVGYLDDDAATRDAFGGGWLHTGDLGEGRADGGFAIVGRIDDVFSTGGESVVPSAVERALLRLPGILEAAVVGVPDPDLGTVGAAFVVAAPGVDPSLATVRGHLADVLPRHALPRRLHLVPSLPRTALGKVDRRALRKDSR